MSSHGDCVRPVLMKQTLTWFKQRPAEEPSARGGALGQWRVVLGPLLELSPVLRLTQKSGAMAMKGLPVGRCS